MADRTADDKILVIDCSDPDCGEAFLDDLFAVDKATKQAGAITKDNYRGFIPPGFFTPNRDDG